MLMSSVLAAAPVGGHAIKCCRGFPFPLAVAVAGVTATAGIPPVPSSPFFPVRILAVSLLPLFPVPTSVRFTPEEPLPRVAVGAAADGLSPPTPASCLFGGGRMVRLLRLKVSSLSCGLLDKGM